MKKIVKNIFIILDGTEKKKFVVLALLDVAISILDISFLAFLLYVVNFYTGQHLKNVSHFPFNLFTVYPLLLITVFFILFSLKNMAGFLIIKAQNRFVYDVASRLSKKNLGMYFAGSYLNYVNVDSSVHIRKISQQPIEFAHYVLRGVQQIISQAILIGITIIAVLIFNPVLFLLLFIVLMPPVILTSYFMKRKLNSVRLHTKSTSAKTIQHLQESISSFIESNVYDKKEFFTNRYHGFQNKLNALLADQQVIQNMPSRLIEVFAVFGLFALILVNSYTVNTGSLQVLVIGAFMAAAYKIIPGIVKILNTTGQIKTYEFTVHDLLQNGDLTKMKMEYNPDTIGSVEFAKVSFAYKAEKVINDLSLKMNAGDLIGITGLSGKGKTTVINLLLGFLKPCSGSVIINDEIRSNGMLQQYWDKISYVKQQPFFIHDSILKNIILQEGDCNTRKFSEVIAATGLDEIINNFSEGVHTLITENGRNFSGGQRQRLILARALYKDFDLIILDEPFSELDEAAERQLLIYFTKISHEGKIVMLITHSKTALSVCNKTVSLDQK